MSIAEHVRNFAREAEPVIEEWLIAAEVIAGFRDAAKEKGINWAQLKALLVAKVRDDKDGGDRLEKLTKKYDLALEYCGMLGSNVAEENKSPPQSVREMIETSPQRREARIAEILEQPEVKAALHRPQRPSPEEESTTEFSEQPPSTIPQSFDAPIDVDSPSGDEIHESEPAVVQPLIRGGEGDPDGDAGFDAGSPLHSDDERYWLPEFCDRRNELVCA